MPTKSKIPTITVTAGLDIGNGDSKCKIAFADNKPIVITVPSAIAYTTGSNTPSIATSEYMDYSNLANSLDAQVVGPGIKSIDEGRVFFGKRAINSGESLTMFNITNHVPKSQDSLSAILIDGILASTAVSQFYKDNQTLPELIKLNVALGIALPIDDYRDYRDSYKNNLMSRTHTVTIRNFEKPIQVEIDFKAVVIMAEGAAAQEAIHRLGAAFIQAALDKARKDGANIDKAYTGEILAKSTNSIGIDLGDGTVNFPVITKQAINKEVSSSINKGYGTVLDGAVQDLIDTNASFQNRRDLIDFMMDDANKVMPAQKQTYDVAKRAIDAHKQVFARDIRMKFTDIFRKVGQRTQVIWVYGGGSTPMQKVLEPILITETKVGSGTNIPVLWMDSSYSRNLNRNGLYDAAKYGRVQAKLQ